MADQVTPYMVAGAFKRGVGEWLRAQLRKKSIAPNEVASLRRLLIGESLKAAPRIVDKLFSINASGDDFLSKAKGEAIDVCCRFKESGKLSPKPIPPEYADGLEAYEMNTLAKAKGWSDAGRTVEQIAGKLHIHPQDVRDLLDAEAPTDEAFETAYSVYARFESAVIAAKRIATSSHVGNAK